MHIKNFYAKIKNIDYVGTENFMAVTSIINAFREYSAELKKTNIFSISGFIKMLEPIFAAEGYRQVEKITAYTARNQTKILILHDAAVGDFVIHTGLIREIRRIYPAAYITLLVKEKVIQLAELCPYVDEIIVNRGHFSYLNFGVMLEEYIKLAEKFLPRRFDICYSLAYIAETQLLMYMSGARVRIASNVYKDNNDEKTLSNTKFFNFKNSSKFATHMVPRNEYRCHRVDMAFSFLEHFLHAPIENRSLEIWYSAMEISNAKSYVESASRPIYALYMGGSHPRKHYPPELYAKSLKLISENEPSATFIILGAGKNDLKSAERLKNVAPDIYEKNIIDLTNKLTYRESAAVLSFCDAYIGNDTGTMHIAAAVNCPVLEINSFPADINIMEGDNLAVYYPYNVPNVILRPQKVLPECSADKPHSAYGCRILNKPHCITQINPQLILKSLNFLKKRIADKNYKPLYVS